MRVNTERMRGYGGLTLHVHRFKDERATPSGRTVLLLHGYLDTGATWDRVAAPLAAAGHVVLAPDLRGFGGSDRVPSGGYYHFPDYVADLDAVVRSLAHERLALVGHSMGGAVACLYAGARPERIERLVLVEGLGPPSMPPDQARHRMRRWLLDLEEGRSPRPMASLADAVRRLASHHPQIAHEVLEERARQLTVVTADGLEWAHDPLHRTTSPSLFSAEVLKGFLREVRVPVLYVGGGEQGFHPEDEGDRLAALTDVRHVELADAGHMVHWTRPVELARAILDFLG